MLQLGILADDLTGGMMVASLLEGEGVACPLVTSVERLPELAGSGAEAVVLARRIRLIAPAAAAAEGAQAARALKALGCARLYYKYCATFDSTAQGNIGPVAEAMMAEAGAARTLFCPAFPRHTVTVFQGRMFIGSVPLGESFKRLDPVTPMTESNLVAVLEAQAQGKVGLLSHGLLRQGREAVEGFLGRAEAPSLYIADSADDDDLARIAELSLDWPLTTGADALPVLLARAWRCREEVQGTQEDREVVAPPPSMATPLPNSPSAGGVVFREGAQGTQEGRVDGAPPPPNALHLANSPSAGGVVEGRRLLPGSPGGEAFVAGSCHEATLRQLEAFGARHPVFRVDLVEAAEDAGGYAQRILGWARERLEAGPVGVATSADVAGVARVQGALGREGASQLAEGLLGEVAKGLRAQGVRKFVVAGGETAGAVMAALNVGRVEVAAFDELGGGYCHQAGDNPLSFVLKAGAIGKPDFCFTALERMREADAATRQPAPKATKQG